VGAGIIDEDYRGEIKVLLRNQSDEDILLQKQERIAQLLVLPVIYPIVVTTNELDDSVRGETGFGASGRT
jgi:dUTP pyrophosphatase